MLQGCDVVKIMTLDRRWEKFKGGPIMRGAPKVRVTINRRGLIYLNERAYKLLSSPQAVALYYCRDLDSIALVPANLRNGESFPFVKKQMGWAIHASTFCRHYDIHVKDTEQFLTANISKSGIMTLPLRDTVTVGGIVKPKKSKDKEPRV